MERRTYLSTGIAALTLGLAGCAGGNSTDEETTTQGDDDTSPAATTAPEATTESPAMTTEEPTTEAMPTQEPTTEAMPTEEPTTEPAATPEPTTSTPEPTASTPTPTPEPTGPAQVVTVAADGRFRFAPETFTISAGDTVRWEWAASGHNVVPNDIPSGSDWSGSPGAPGETLNSGATYEHTFEVPGEYSYYCAPHRSLDMVGSFTVE